MIKSTRRHKRTKALAIPYPVKLRVWERDNGCCLLCGTRNAFPDAHYISRAHGGLGVEENIWTACRTCHNRFDNFTDRVRHETDCKFLEEYFKGHYPGWDKNKLHYRKDGIYE